MNSRLIDPDRRAVLVELDKIRSAATKIARMSADLELVRPPELRIPWKASKGGRTLNGQVLEHFLEVLAVGFTLDGHEFYTKAVSYESDEVVITLARAK